jgi:hypothetical protein
MHGEPGGWLARHDAALVGLGVLLALPCFLLSDNLHGLHESTAMNRLTLGLRTFYPGPPGAPMGFAPDPNFPLGSALLFSVPFHLGLPPVAFGRLWALGAALGCTLLAARLLLPIAGRGGAWWGALALWSVPAFVRGAVVSGEESTATALLLGGLLLARRFPAAGVAVACCAVLFRLDALAWAPCCLFAVPRRSWPSCLAACSPVLAMPLLANLWVYGDPFNAASLARDVTAASAAFRPASWLAFPQTVASMLGVQNATEDSLSDAGEGKAPSQSGACTAYPRAHRTKRTAECHRGRRPTGLRSA